jgi:hypothetical protein
MLRYDCCRTISVYRGDLTKFCSILREKRRPLLPISSFPPVATACRSIQSRRRRRRHWPTTCVATPHWQFPPLPSPSRLYTIAFTSPSLVTPLRPEQDQHRPTTPLLFSPALEMDSFASTSSATGAHGAGGGGNKRAATPSGAGPKVRTLHSPLSQFIVDRLRPLSLPSFQPPPSRFSPSTGRRFKASPPETSSQLSGMQAVRSHSFSWRRRGGNAVLRSKDPKTDN